MSSASSVRPAGIPSTIAVNRGPCDSPAVIQRRRDIARKLTRALLGLRLPPRCPLRRNSAGMGWRCYFSSPSPCAASRSSPFEKYEGLGNDFIVVDAGARPT